MNLALGKLLLKRTSVSSYNSCNLLRCKHTSLFLTTNASKLLQNSTCSHRKPRFEKTHFKPIVVNQCCQIDFRKTSTNQSHIDLNLDARNNNIYRFGLALQQVLPSKYYNCEYSYIIKTCMIINTVEINNILSSLRDKRKGLRSHRQYASRSNRRPRRGFKFGGAKHQIKPNYDFFKVILSVL